MTHMWQMLRSMALLAAVALSLLAVSPAAAQSAAASDDTLVVTGEPLSAEQVHDQAVAFVRSLGIARGRQPTARWLVPVCPRIVGLSAAHAAIVEQRMCEIAADAGIAAAPAGCKSNIVVSFVADGARLARDVSRRSTRLAALSPTDRRWLLESAAPIRWWYATQVGSRDGSATSDAPFAGAMTGAEGGGPSIPQREGVASIAHFNSSIVSTQVVRSLVSASVVVDVNLAEGAGLRATAAYAAMVAFAEIAPPAIPPDNSILNLFGTPGQPDISETDLAVLRALYDLPLDREARRHRGLIVRGIVREAAAPVADR